MLQTVIDDWGNIPLYIHFTNSNGTTRNLFEIEQTVTWKASTLMLSGAGKNKSMISAADNLNADMFVFDVGAGNTNAIFEMVGLKFIGNKANNTSGSGLVFKKSNEVNIYRSEVRSFVEDNIKFSPTQDFNWNKMVDLWTLDADGNCLSFIKDGGAIRELDLIGCTIDNQGASGSRGIYIDDTNGSPLQHFNMTGGRFKGSDPVEIESGDQITFNGVHWQAISGVFGIKLGGNTTARVSNVSIKNCQFNGTPTNWIVPQKDVNGAVDPRENIHISNNQFIGQSGAIIKDYTDHFIDWIVHDNNPPVEIDVRNTRNPSDTNKAWHDGSGTGNPRGPAFYNGTDWISLVDGSSIS